MLLRGLEALVRWGFAVTVCGRMTCFFPVRISDVCSGYFLCITAIFLVNNTLISWVVNAFGGYVQFRVLWMLTIKIISSIGLD